MGLMYIYPYTFFVPQFWQSQNLVGMGNMGCYNFRVHAKL